MFVSVCVFLLYPAQSPVQNPIRIFALMAFPLPADKLVALPAADSADKEESRKSKSRKARRGAKDEARLFYSYTMVEMDDLEDIERIGKLSICPGSADGGVANEMGVESAASSADQKESQTTAAHGADQQDGPVTTISRILPGFGQA